MIGAVAVMVNVAKTVHQARFAAAAAEILTAKTAFGTDPGSSVTTVADVIRVRVLPVRTARRCSRKDFSTQRLLCLANVTFGRPVPV